MRHRLTTIAMITGLALSACGSGADNPSADSLPPGTVPTVDTGTPTSGPPTTSSGESEGGWLDGEPEWVDESYAGEDSAGDMLTAAPAATEDGDARSVGAPAPGGATSDIPVPADDVAPPVEAGPLRAGSVDDNADFAGYLEYLERIRSLGIPLREFDPTGRIVVTVTGT
jgi:hypothetical protein